MRIQIANPTHYDYIFAKDKHVLKDLINSKISNQEIYIIIDEDICIGWLRYGYFWDNLPFMNMLWVDEEFRGKGYGKAVVAYWEQQMKGKGFETVMTSTLANEQAQHFYRKLGYKDSGSLLLDDEPLEIIFTKKL